jgi:hypothetical protein
VQLRIEVCIGGQHDLAADLLRLGRQSWLGYADDRGVRSLGRALIFLDLHIWHAALSADPLCYPRGIHISSDFGDLHGGFVFGSTQSPPHLGHGIVSQVSSVEAGVLDDNVDI